MNELGNTSNKAYKKSARIVGEVMGEVSPSWETVLFTTQSSGWPRNGR